MNQKHPFKNYLLPFLAIFSIAVGIFLFSKDSRLPSLSSKLNPILSTSQAGSSDITIQARGTNGKEKIALYINNTPVTFWNLSNNFQDYTYTPNTQVTINELSVHFLNDTWEPEQNINYDVQIPYITVNGERYNSEHSSTVSTGSWDQDNWCAPGNKQTQWLNCNGSFTYNIPVGTVVGVSIPPTDPHIPAIITNPTQDQEISGDTAQLEFRLNGDPDEIRIVVRSGIGTDQEIDYFEEGRDPVTDAVVASPVIIPNLPQDGTTIDVTIATWKGDDLQVATQSFVSRETSSTPPTACSEDRIASLLASPDRIGFGRNTTGGAAATSLTVVTNTNDSGSGSLRDAILSGNGPKWIIFDPSIYGRTITLNSPLNIHESDFTIDGRGENGQMADMTISIGSGDSFNLMNLRGGNVILHGLTFDANGTRATLLSARQGDPYWLDHLTMTGTTYDDSIGIGQDGQPDSATDVTVSNYHVYNANYALLAGNSEDPNDHERHSFVTIHSSHLSARDRNPNVSGGAKVHAFNNYVHGFTYKGMVAVRSGEMIAHNNVISADAANNTKRAIAGIAGAGTIPGHVHEWDNLLINGAEIDADSSINPSSPAPFNIPYSYDVRPSAQVQSYVIANAGADNASGSLEYCE